MIENQMLKDIKNYLDITWEDEDGDKKIIGIAERGMNHLQEIAGGSLDFMAESSARELLFDYCRYARSNALEVFGTNFKGELTALRIKTMVTNYENQNGNTDGSI